VKSTIKILLIIAILITIAF